MKTLKQIFDIIIFLLFVAINGTIFYDFINEKDPSNYIIYAGIILYMTIFSENKKTKDGK